MMPCLQWAAGEQLLCVCVCHLLISPGRGGRGSPSPPKLELTPVPERGRTEPLLCDKPTGLLPARSRARLKVTFQPAAAGKFEFALAATVRAVGQDGAPFELSAAASAPLELGDDSTVTSEWLRDEILMCRFISTIGERTARAWGRLAPRGHAQGHRPVLRQGPRACRGPRTARRERRVQHAAAAREHARDDGQCRSAPPRGVGGVARRPPRRGRRRAAGRARGLWLVRRAADAREQ